METGKWKVFSIYNGRGESRKLQEIKGRIEESKERNLIIARDFNAKTGSKGSIAWLGKELLQIIEENGLGILNGNMVSDKEGEWTFIGQMGNSVVDYTIREVKTWERIREFKIGERTESDYQPIEIEIKEECEQRERPNKS